MKHASGLTERRKEENALGWVGRMNHIRMHAVEILNGKIIDFLALDKYNEGDLLGIGENGQSKLSRRPMAVSSRGRWPHRTQRPHPHRMGKGETP